MPPAVIREHDPVAERATYPLPVVVGRTTASGGGSA
jgi:hypothetical protein